jgi:hypothetical protein
MPAWHPNFRNAERLPDTKAVRTSFFINAVAIFAVSTLALYTGYREYGLNVLRSDISVVRAEIDSKKSASEQAVVLYQTFQAEEKKVLELQSFLSTSKIVASDFILLLGETLPSSVSLGNIDYRGTAVTLRGSIEGAPDEASGRAISYVDSLRNHTAFTAFFETITLSNIVRDPGTGKMQFVIDLKFKPTGQAAKGGKK